MARINLLPWRAERRVQRQREFYVMLGAAAIAGLLLSFLLWFHYDRQVSGQTERNDFLKDEIAKVQAQNKEIEKLDEQKRRLLARKEVIEKLQANRSQMVHLFDSLVRTIPDGVMLANIKQEGEVLTLQGRAQSNARVSAYMRNLETSGWMTKPELSIIEAKPEEVKTLTNTGAGSALPYVFTLQVRLANPTAEQQAESAAAGPNAPAATPAATPAPAPLEGQPAAPAPAAPAPTPPAGGTTPTSGSNS
ncbi:MAG: fimbrial protein [Xanthomonas sp.]|jgi:type IV pilus assembly protein PilN|uniref:PilN domain-containing protein n=1 Tax=Pseudoxanthomonas mexicana TaxID=128785 RepID=UPI0007862623|nr:PilN domain-containing protein [Pseudoxanthomonas mexicana]MBA3929283.1 fimbrial protein [Xanthomonas sp.]MBL8256682.1 PilN domain-containing protein [Pseudoxanthomonas mexicana]